MTSSSIAIIGLTQLLREGLQALLHRSQFLVILKVANIEEAIASVKFERPDIAIVAISESEDTTEWVEKIRRNRVELDGIRIVLLTDNLTATNVRHAAAVGVNATLSNNITGDVFQRCLELVVLGQQFFPCFPDELHSRPSAALLPFSRTMLTSTIPTEPALPTMPSALRDTHVSEITEGACQRSTALSDRERQILCCLVEGAPNKTIARELQITEATVKVHIKGLLRKIRVSNRTQAAVWGLNNKVLMEEPTPMLQENARPGLNDRQIAI